MTEIQEPFESRVPKRAPVAPTLSGGTKTQLSLSLYSEAGNPLNERSQALDLRATILPQKNCKNRKKGVYII